MYHLHVMGTAPDSLAATIGVIRHIPDLCKLVFEPAPLIDQEDEVKGYVGDLVSAPPGKYNLWVCKPSEPLLVTHEKFLIGRTLLLTRETTDKLKCQLPEHVRKAFSELYARSERLVAVYQHDVTGDQQYELVWDGDDPGSCWHNRPDIKFIGYANLLTGDIEL